MSDQITQELPAPPTVQRMVKITRTLTITSVGHYDSWGPDETDESITEYENNLDKQDKVMATIEAVEFCDEDDITISTQVEFVEVSVP